MITLLFTHDEQGVHQLSPPLKDLAPGPGFVKVKEYSGNWGALVVSLGPYNGFEPYEDETYICVVIGGPVLYWRDNRFLTDSQQPTAATHSILQRWHSGTADWSEDLSGPFVIFIVNKKTSELLCYTDPLMFIPVYQHTAETALCLGTHVDTVDKISEQRENTDDVSIASFILHDIASYPHTIYKKLYQLAPTTEHKWVFESNKYIEQRTPYWEPLENNPYKNINEAATVLRTGLTEYIERITEKMAKVGQFISTGEDSCSLSGMLPPEKPRDAYIFLDHMNSEGMIAKKVADIYKVSFTVGYKSKTHYLDILPEAASIVGAGHQYTHTHSLGFDKKYKLAEYPAVFGGYLSDSLLKGAFVPKVRGAGRFPFVPDFEVNCSPVGKQLSMHAAIVGEDVLESIKVRQHEHFEFIKKIRPTTANEWFVLYPASMRVAIPNYYSTRRLFKSYEPFLSHEFVKVAATVPASWKLNRRLFKRAMRSFLKPSKWVLHADGRQGPWGDWGNGFSSEQWNNQLQEFSKQHRLSFLQTI